MHNCLTSGSQEKKKIHLWFNYSFLCICVLILLLMCFVILVLNVLPVRMKLCICKQTDIKKQNFILLYNHCFASQFWVIRYSITNICHFLSFILHLAINTLTYHMFYFVFYLLSIPCSLYKNLVLQKYKVLLILFIAVFPVPPTVWHIFNFWQCFWMNK